MNQQDVWEDKQSCVQFDFPCCSSSDFTFTSSQTVRDTDVPRLWPPRLRRSSGPGSGPAPWASHY